MKTVEYDPNKGEPIRDGYVGKTVDVVIASPDQSVWSFSTENIFFAIEVAVKEGRIEHDKIQFSYGGKPIGIMEDGRPQNWSSDFMTFSQDLLIRLL